MRKGSDTYATLKAAELGELLKLEFLDCIHPDLYESKAAIGTFRTHLKELIPNFWGVAFVGEYIFSWIDKKFNPPAQSLFAEA